MGAARDIDEADHEWRSFLNFIAQVLEKLARGYRNAAGAVTPWIGQQCATRDADPLLEYLYQARHADQHTTQDAVDKIPGRRELRIGAGERGVFIERLEIRDGRVVTYRGSAPIQERVTPPKLALAPIVTRGSEYAPPTSHLGQPFESRDPLDAAAAAIRHYERVLSAFREKFLID